jgi:ankyrin repeat protein
VYCQVVYLRGCHPGRIRHALSGLPETLDETYERTLREINKADWDLAYRLFQCVAVASRPLRVEELAEFLAFDFQAGPIPKFQEGWRLDDPVDAVLSTCSTLLTLVSVDGSPVIQFTHFSVKEFLTSTRLAEAADKILRRYYVSMTPAHTLISQACLGILLHLNTTITRDDLKKYPLTDYAARHWVDHARFENVSQYVEEGMKALFDPRKPRLAIWVWICDPRNPLRDYERAERPPPPEGTPLHYAAVCGLHGIVKFLTVEHSQDVHSRRFDDGWTPLHVASTYGHMAIARILVEQGADETARDNNGKTPLLLASRKGHVELARFLVEYGADPIARDNDGKTPLHEASIHGHVELARFLVEYGVDAIVRDDNGGTALHWASSHGRLDVARFLVERGADVTARDKFGNTPLHVASGEGNIKVVCFLLEHGADVTARNNDGRISLHLASSYGYIEVARILVQHGADATAQANDGQSPLHVASSYGNVEIARILLEHGADVTARANNGSTPLHGASSCGGVQVARFLVEHGADATARNNTGSTPWNVASRKGHVELTRFLLEHDAGAAARINDGRTPLHVVAEEENVGLVRVRVEHGTDATTAQPTQGSRFLFYFFVFCFFC